MQPSVETAPVSKTQLWAGRVISALPVLMLLLSGVMKLLKPVAVVQGFAHYGYPGSQIVFLGILEIACTLVYVIPRTAYLGAILMTSYLGGATASNVRGCVRSCLFAASVNKELLQPFFAQPISI